MKAIVVNQGGGPEVLEPAEREAPAPVAGRGADRVACDRRELRRRLGPARSRSAADVPDAAGDVEGLAPGDRVVAAPWFARGAYAEPVASPATHVWRIPDEIDFDVAAAVPLNYLTAYVGLVRFAGVGQASRSSISRRRRRRSRRRAARRPARRPRDRNGLAHQARVPPRPAGRRAPSSTTPGPVGTTRCASSPAAASTSSSTASARTGTSRASAPSATAPASRRRATAPASSTARLRRPGIGRPGDAIGALLRALRQRLDVLGGQPQRSARGPARLDGRALLGLPLRRARAPRRSGLPPCKAASAHEHLRHHRRNIGKVLLRP